MNYAYRIGVTWQATEQGSYRPMFVGQMLVDGTWIKVSPVPRYSELESRLDLFLILKVCTEHIDPVRVDTREFNE